jgi:5'-nucleotidase
MEDKRPLVLITNDDSVDAPGLYYLVDSVIDVADVIVVAPSHPHSGQSAAISVGRPLQIHSHGERRGANVYSVNGTPVDCVKLGLQAIVPRRPDMILSGINHGSNSGTAVTYSGTMGAVLEGCMVGIASVGFSLLSHAMDADFTLSALFVKKIAQDVLFNSLPKGVCLNVNIPSKVVPLGVRTCRAAKGHWSEEYAQYTDPQGNPFYWLTGRFCNEEPDATDTDEYWLTKNYISVVPVTPDQTYFSHISDMTTRFDETL